MTDTKTDTTTDERTFVDSLRDHYDYIGTSERPTAPVVDTTTTTHKRARVETTTTDTSTKRASGGRFASWVAPTTYDPDRIYRTERTANATRIRFYAAGDAVPIVVNTVTAWTSGATVTTSRGYWRDNGTTYDEASAVVETVVHAKDAGAVVRFVLAACERSTEHAIMYTTESTDCRVVHVHEYATNGTA